MTVGLTLTLTYPQGWWGRCKKKKNLLEKKITRSAPVGVGAQTWDLLCARQESSGARHEGRMFAQHHVQHVLEIVKIL